MKWTDEHIDQLFRKAAKSQSEIPYQDNYWKEMEALLPAKKGRKKAIVIWSAAVFAVLLFVSSLFLVKSSMETNPKSAVASGEARQLDLNQKDKLESNELSGNKTANLQPTTSTATGSVQLPVGDINQSASEKRLSEAEYGETEITANGLETAPAENNNMLTDQIGLTVEMSNLADSQFDIDGAANESATIFLNLLPVGIRQEITSSERSSAETSKLELQRVDRWYGELNAGVSQAWIKPENGNSATFASLGIAAGKIMRIGKLDFHAGLGVSYTRFDQMLISERTIVYGFGKQILENTYKFNSITSAQLPLMLSMQRGRHEFGAGLTAQLNLFSVVSHKKSMDGSQFYTSKGYTGTDLFSSFGLTSVISYDYAINEQLQLGARAQLQLIKPVKSDRFLGEAVSNPVGIQFFIRRTFSFN